MKNINAKDIVSFILAIVTIVGVILLTLTDHEIPQFLVAGVGSIFAFFFGIPIGVNNDD